MKVEIVPGNREHAVMLAESMRLEDVRELEACGQTPLEGLTYSLGLSEVAYAVMLDGQVGAMVGVVRSNQAGFLWLLTGELFGERPKEFLRAARRLVADLLERYRALFNVIDGRYTGALLLAMSLGAEFGSPVMVGAHPFIPFRLRRH